MSLGGLGSPCVTPCDGADGLNYIDRHEVAHFVLDQLRPNGDNLEVPMLLIEGWAELHAGQRGVLPCKAWTAQREGELSDLELLTNANWFHNSTGPVYWQGSVLVDYLLRQIGHKKFLELCNTCREASFDEDVKRVLGMSLEELDKAYRQDLAAQDSPDKRLLKSWTLADGVDPKQWRRFVDDIARALNNCHGVSPVQRNHDAND